MDREWKQVLVVVGAVLILVLVFFAGIRVYSGLDNSMTVVVSGSMEHGDKSEIGIIDTGDMIVMKNKDKSLTTYVEGYSNGCRMFGEYGDVVIYERETGNPVIHRAILWMDYNGDGTYSAPTLKKEDYGKLWTTDSRSNENFTSLNLYLPYKGSSTDFKWVEFVAEKGGYHSGYLTKGDNNTVFDCGSIKDVNGLVEEKQIKAVAGLEIPWVGAVKLFIKGDTGDIQSNTPFCLTFLILDILALIALLSIVWDIVDRRYFNE